MSKIIARLGHKDKDGTKKESDIFLSISEVATKEGLELVLDMGDIQLIVDKDMLRLGLQKAGIELK